MNSLKAEMKLMDAGFEQDSFTGELKYKDDSGLKIIAYRGTEWEIDITLPNGKVISHDGGRFVFPDKEPINDVSDDRF